MPAPAAKPVRPSSEERKRAAGLRAAHGRESIRALRPTAAPEGFQRVVGEADKMEDRLGRLDAAREALALRQASPGASRECSETKSASSP